MPSTTACDGRHRGVHAAPHAGRAFGSGMYVFPGGRSSRATARTIDQRYRLAAIRECFEEAGVLLALDERRPPRSPTAIRRWTHRQAVHDGSIDLVDAVRRARPRPAIDELAWVSHWITPAGEAARRFDTRFYVAPAPPEQASRHDDNETIDSLWVRPADALAPPGRGRADDDAADDHQPRSSSPQFASVDEAMAAAHAMPPPSRSCPRCARTPTASSPASSMPGDPDYDRLA